MEKVIVVKIGGSTFDSRDTTLEDIVSLQKAGRLLVVVHGGANVVTEWLRRQGIATRFVHGERVTDAATLEVVTAVLAGLVNKEIVAAVNCLGGQAVGISGVDGTLIESKMKGKDMGYVGEVVKVNTALLEGLLENGFVPVVSPLSLYSVDRPAEAPRIMNVNGDHIAGEDHFDSLPLADQTGQPLRAAPAGDDAQVDLRLAETGPVGANAHVASHR